MLNYPFFINITKVIYLYKLVIDLHILVDFSLGGGTHPYIEKYYK